MLHDPTYDTTSLGADIRALRKARSLTLADVAETLGRSVGWLSQVERDLSQPSINDLRDLAKVLEVPVSMLFGQPNVRPEETGRVVRRGARRPIGSGEAGLIEELLSPDLTDDFEVVHSTFLPHSRIKEFVHRPTQEVGYVVSGRLRLDIGEQSFDLDQGDSFRIKDVPFRWHNPHDTRCEVIWVIAPPVY